MRPFWPKSCTGDVPALSSLLPVTLAPSTPLSLICITIPLLSHTAVADYILYKCFMQKMYMLCIFNVPAVHILYAICVLHIPAMCPLRSAALLFHARTPSLCCSI